MERYPLVSVYTSVYNGAKTIDRVFKSIRNLDYPNLEHVIVNNGSTDDTEKLIEEYIRTAPCTVKYRKKEYGGKHTAINLIWNMAEGEFIINLDADDELLPHSVRFLVDTYYEIPEDIRSQYWCVHGCCVTQHGDFVGDKYPENINDQPWQEAGKEAAKCSGEKIGLKVRAYLNSYRFPEVVGTDWVPEGIIWDQLNKKYGTWYTNEIVRVYYVGENGIVSGTQVSRKKFSSKCFWFKWMLMHPDMYGKSFLNFVYYSMLYFISDRNYRSHNGYTRDLEKYRLLLWLLCPVTLVGAFVYRILKGIK